jgi:hypothetical protein
MAFDSTTRAKLQRLVAACRKLLTDEFDDQLQSLYGIYAEDGRVLELDTLRSLDDDQRAIGALLRERIAHLQSGLTGSKTPLADAVQRVLREQAFTILNRFAALRMAEERELVLQCVGDGLNSKGFQVFENVASPDLGSQYERYRVFLDCLFDELSLDLGVLFDRFSPFGLLFPREPKLKEFLHLLNDPELKSLWREDETIGWIYQYFNGNDVKEMREAAKGGAPRNSRELAVRNQFFTPRYVVEFLTDNTLGRLWYEMTRGETVLRDRCRYLVRRPTEIFLKEGEPAPESTATSGAEENPSQEYLLRAPVHIPHRPLKDPLTISVLDPACGSMHFGLYAFDLFECIYDEAWEIAHGTDEALKSAPSFASFVSYAAQFTDKAAFLREVPRLIVEHNLHGIDIDPRAAQIAGLSLWLRAHRAWQRAGVKPATRPRITRSKLVCAEPMPGEKELLREFVEGAFPAGERPAFAFLLEKIFDCMTLAGEAGSLLRVEEEIRTAIADAKRLWKQGPKVEQAMMFAEPGEKVGQGEMRLDLSGITDEQFWERAEQRIYEALETYAGQAENGGGFQRRLFANDAAQGFAFIDLCRKRYDVVVMNPPFGEPSERLLEYVVARYADINKNLLCGFLLRGKAWLQPGGRVGAIYDRTAIVKNTYEDFRRNFVLNSDALSAQADLGWEVLDANVEVTSSVFEYGSSGSECLFADVRQSPRERKGEDLLDKIHQVTSGQAKDCKLFRSSRFLKFPNAVLGYDFPDFVVRMFVSLGKLAESGVQVIQGHTILSDRYFRYWWEVPPLEAFTASAAWQRFYNGGEYSRFNSGLPDAVLYGSAGDRIAQNQSTIFRNTGLQMIGKVGFGKRGEFIDAHILPQGFVSSVEGQAVILREGVDPFAILAFLNSQIFQTVINLYCGQHKYPGYVHLFPTPPLDAKYTKAASEAAKRAYKLKESVESADETNPRFFHSGTITPFEADFVDRVNSAYKELREQEQAMNDSLNTAYALGSDAVNHINGFCAREPATGGFLSDEPARYGQAALRLSFAFGSSFGRWDTRYVTGEQPKPVAGDPFAALPVCPPATLRGPDGFPLAAGEGRRLHASGEYPLDVAWDGILVDDPEHSFDVERRVHASLALLWGDGADDLEHDACAILGVPTLREWFRRPTGFFADHLSRYSKSRRQAPIYWPLSTVSGGYTLWLYYPRLSGQTLYTCLNDFVKPKLEAVTADANRLQTKTQAGSTAKERDELQELRDFQSELQEMQKEMIRVAQLPWRPNLNDGVLITASPLWQLFRLPQWQRDLKTCWDELTAGEYDWAHLAMAIRPNEVREKCKKDRSLAVAHGLESICQAAAKKTRSTRKAKADNLDL